MHYNIFHNLQIPSVYKMYKTTYQHSTLGQLYRAIYLMGKIRFYREFGVFETVRNLEKRGASSRKISRSRVPPLDVASHRNPRAKSFIPTVELLPYVAPCVSFRSVVLGRRQSVGNSCVGCRETDGRVLLSEKPTV